MSLKKYIPNAFTLGNLILGTIAIIFIIEGVKPIFGAYCLIGALAFDYLDGFSARILRSYSEIGKQLDSLADMVSFGVAPSIIAFKFVSPEFYEIGQGSESVLWRVIGFSVFIMAAASAYRLAKFNLDKDQVESFKGLPTPANGIFWIGLLAARENDLIPDFINSFLIENPWNLTFLVFIFSALLISNIRMFSLKFSFGQFKELVLPLIMLIFGIILFVFFEWLALPLIVILYIIISLIKSLIKT